MGAGGWVGGEVEGGGQLREEEEEGEGLLVLRTTTVRVYMRDRRGGRGGRGWGWGGGGGGMAPGIGSRVSFLSFVTLRARFGFCSAQQ